MKSSRLIVESDGIRADRFLADALPGLGRKAAAEYCERGLVRRSGRRLKKSDLLARGDVVEVDPEDDVPEVGWDDRVRILEENDDFVVANKPPKMPSGALRGSTKGTLAGSLLSRYPEMANVGFSPREPGLLHRLDTFTSGAILAARTPESFSKLREALEASLLEKEYLALTTNKPPEDSGVVRSPLGPDPRGSPRVTTLAGAPRETRYEVLGGGRRLFLIELRVSAAYRHQIRAHLALVGSPLLGDRLYGGESWRPDERHALHASRLAMAPQTTGTGLSSFGFNVRAPLPEDFEEALIADGFSLELVSRFKSR